MGSHNISGLLHHSLRACHMEGYAREWKIGKEYGARK